jgi:hypothetical protein
LTVQISIGATNLINRQAHYFAGDGNYGAADRVAIVDTGEWSEDDWLELEEAYDLDRMDVALKIESKYRG